jgi:hypothetical protein
MTLGVGVSTAVAVAIAGMATTAEVAVGAGRGVAVTASATVATARRLAGASGVASLAQPGKRVARIRIKVRVPRIMIVCLLVSDPRWGDRVVVQIEPDCLSGRYAGG